jgi:hypothetical protein
MSAPSWMTCDSNPCTCTKAEPERTAEDILRDVLDLCSVYEAKQVAHRWIRPSEIRFLIENGRKS